MITRAVMCLLLFMPLYVLTGSILNGLKKVVEGILAANVEVWFIESAELNCNSLTFVPKPIFMTYIYAYLCRVVQVLQL